MPPILFTLVKRQPVQSARQIGSPRVLCGWQPLPAVSLRIFGVTKNSAGAALGGCTVHLFETLVNKAVDEGVSDGSGNYEFRSASLSTQYYVRAYKAGAPDVAGTTINTLVGT